MIEVSVARLRSRLASLLEIARGGEPIVIRRHGARIAVLTGLRPGRDAARAASLRAMGGPSKLPRTLDTGPVEPVKLRIRPRRAPSLELSEERE
ncbi:MAG TPA: type II toxin-antitoxin system prevent-host-death family antitoxin [Planctomycetota bacterium]|jgi:prevent-host-death family protein|nr:type II toxin-antitoxin system prevent-host-death family antitoxin [Planctomycetota bacterium]